MKPPSLSSPAAARLLAAALLATSASPALAVTPFKMRIPVGPIVAAAPAPDISVPGYDPVTGLFSAPSGSFTWDGTAGTYTLPSGTAFGITGSVTLALAATADGVKTAMRNNPQFLSGTLAGPWLALQGMQLLPDYSFSVADEPPGHMTPCTLTAGFAQYACFALGALQTPDTAQRAQCLTSVPNGGSFGVYNLGDGLGWRAFCYYAPLTVFPSRPATDEDWDALPDPLPAVGAELPYAPYMPSGVAVQNNFTINDLSTGTVHHCTNGGCD